MTFEPHTPAAGSDGFIPPTARFTLGQPPFAGESFGVTFRACGSPCCPCGVVTFECRAEAAPELPPRCFDLDLFQRELTTQVQSAPEGVALGRAFLAEAQEPEWVWLCEFFLNTKRLQMEAMDLDTVAVDLPADFKDDAGTMVSYRDVFPWAESLEFQHGGRKWFAEDQFCARPGCNCTEVGLGCFQRTADGQPSAKPLECVTLLFHDYVSGKTRVDTAQPGSPGPDALLPSLRAALPDLPGLLRRRHGQLQHLGRRFQSRSRRPQARRPYSYLMGDGLDEGEALLPPAFAPAAPRSAPVGRNDPCPCGSGKKFKKCCGAA